MNVLVGEKIAEAIRDCALKNVAVAFVGADWKSFIKDPPLLEAIIVSPTLGSNPHAISEIARSIGWSKVFFLDELHAKLYLGKHSAVLGSANLTNNGLSGDALIELGVTVAAKQELQGLEVIFDDWKSKAERMYPTNASKKARLAELENNWAAAVVAKVIEGGNPAKKKFSDFELLGKNHFYVSWYQPLNCTFSNAVKDLGSSAADDLHLTKEEHVEKYKWVLLWQATNAFAPHKSVKPYWFFVHEIFENGVIDEGYDYPNCAIQRNDLPVPTPPFELTQEVIEAFRHAIQLPKLAEYFVQRNKIYTLEKSQDGIERLVSEMKSYLSNPARSRKKR